MIGSYGTRWNKSSERMRFQRNCLRLPSRCACSGTAKDRLDALSRTMGSGISPSTDVLHLHKYWSDLRGVHESCRKERRERDDEVDLEGDSAKDNLVSVYMHLERRLDGSRYPTTTDICSKRSDVSSSMKIARKMLLELSEINQMLLPDGHPLRLACSFETLIISLKPSIDPEDHLILDMVLEKGKGMGLVGAVAPGGVLSNVHASTTLRALLLKGLGSGLRNDAPERAIEMRWKWRYAELCLELSAMQQLAKFSDGGLAVKPVAEEMLMAITLCLRNMGLGHNDPRQFMLLERRIASWQSDWSMASAIDDMDKQRLFVVLLDVLNDAKEVGREGLERAGSTSVPTADAASYLSESTDSDLRHRGDLKAGALLLPRLCDDVILAIRMSA